MRLLGVRAAGKEPHAKGWRGPFWLQRRSEKAAVRRYFGLAAFTMLLIAAAHLCIVFIQSGDASRRLEEQPPVPDWISSTRLLTMEELGGVQEFQMVGPLPKVRESDVEEHGTIRLLLKAVLLRDRRTILRGMLYYEQLANLQRDMNGLAIAPPQLAALPLELRVWESSNNRLGGAPGSIVEAEKAVAPRRLALYARQCANGETRAAEEKRGPAGDDVAGAVGTAATANAAAADAAAANAATGAIIPNDAAAAAAAGLPTDPTAGTAAAALPVDATITTAAAAALPVDAATTTAAAATLPVDAATNAAAAALPANAATTSAAAATLPVGAATSAAAAALPVDAATNAAAAALPADATTTTAAAAALPVDATTNVAASALPADAATTSAAAATLPVDATTNVAASALPADAATTSAAAAALPVDAAAAAAGTIPTDAAATAVGGQAVVTPLTGVRRLTQAAGAAIAESSVFPTAELARQMDERDGSFPDTYAGSALPSHHHVSRCLSPTDLAGHPVRYESVEFRVDLGDLGQYLANPPPRTNVWLSVQGWPMGLDLSELVADPEVADAGAVEDDQGEEAPGEAANGENGRHLAQAGDGSERPDAGDANGGKHRIAKTTDRGKHHAPEGANGNARQLAKAEMGESADGREVSAARPGVPFLAGAEVSPRQALFTTLSEAYLRAPTPAVIHVWMFLYWPKTFLEKDVPRLVEHSLMSGASGVMAYVSPSYGEQLLQHDDVRDLVLAGRLALVSWRSFARPVKLPVYEHGYMNAHAILSHWGRNVWTWITDVDELLALPPRSPEREAQVQRDRKQRREQKEVIVALGPYGDGEQRADNGSVVLPQTPLGKAPANKRPARSLLKAPGTTAPSARPATTLFRPGWNSAPGFYSLAGHTSLRRLRARENAARERVEKADASAGASKGGRRSTGWVSDNVYGSRQLDLGAKRASRTVDGQTGRSLATVAPQVDDSAHGSAPARSGARFSLLGAGGLSAPRDALSALPRTPAQLLPPLSPRQVRLAEAFVGPSCTREALRKYEDIKKGSIEDLHLRTPRCASVPGLPTYSGLPQPAEGAEIPDGARMASAGTTAASLRSARFLSPGESEYFKPAMHPDAVGGTTVHTPIECLGGRVEPWGRPPPGGVGTPLPLRQAPDGRWMVEELGLPALPASANGSTPAPPVASTCRFSRPCEVVPTECLQQRHLVSFHNVRKKISPTDERNDEWLWIYEEEDVDAAYPSFGYE